LVFTAFGLAIGPLGLDLFTGEIDSEGLRTLAELTLALTGLKMWTDEKLFMGWFRPRGLASIVFAVIVLNEHLPGGDIITMTVTCTIILSVVAHGISATPLVASLVVRLQRAAGE
jgi:NhaP-type Na+/H+ or K+/H+ antiporter